MIPFPFLPIVAGLALASSPAHPHMTKATIVPGVKGKVVVTYLTVPYNPDNIKDLEPGFVFSAPAAQVKTDMALVAGNVKIPAGEYALKARLDDNGKTWSVMLVPGGENAKPLILPSKPFAAAKTDSLLVSAVINGYLTESMGSTEAAGGVAGELRISFGDLHTGFAFVEAFPTDHK